MVRGGEVRLLLLLVVRGGEVRLLVLVVVDGEGVEVARFFHITREDEESYRITGEIPLHTIDQAVRKAMVLDGALTGTRPTCKEFLRGLCNMQNCRFRHLSQREYEDEIFHALQEEFESLLGPPEHRPTSPPIGAHPYASLATFHDAAQKYAAQADFREDVLPPDDMRGALMPLSEYESEPKRPRYFSGDAVFPGEDYRNGGDVPRKWDERMPYDHMERPELNAGDVYRLQEELYAIRNENAEMRRGAERDITELKEEVRRVLEENANLHHEVAKVRAVATDESLLQKATIDKLTLTNNTLMEDLRKAQDTARHIEHDCLEKLKVMDGKQKNNSMQLEHKIQEVQKEASMLRDALNKANNIQKKTEDEKVRLRGELDDMRAKMRNQSAASSLRKDSQQHGTGSYGNKNAYPRDSGRQAQMPEHSGATFPDMRHGDRRPPDIRDQEVRGSEMYSPEEVWGGDNSTRPPYDNSYGVRGGALEGDRSRWHGAPTSQDAWGSHGGAKGTGSLMGEYQGGDDRSRGPPQNTPLIRGPSYPSPAGSGLLNLPIDVVDYGKSSTRPPQDSSQGGIESQYGQERRRFEDRSYSLSGYDTDARGSQFGHQHSSTGWQQGGDGGRGRPIDQGWRREKPF
ncbi:hypothetical protein GWK47_026211 [Chionoecetes opilio]|uniref:C3H1-type domain-containing protein n=1 Tax=Chionoecetes opilio TaxID=41210 RepID=A0A8J8WL97_CHIOP|nr:hypothetical protein GWK47_026211 [Chionoecetes opilio]